MLFTYIYFYEEDDSVIECDQLPLLIDDFYIENHDNEHCKMIFERYGILKSVKYYENK